MKYLKNILPILFLSLFFITSKAQSSLTWIKPAEKSGLGIYETDRDIVEFVLQSADTLRDVRVKVFRNGEKLNKGIKSDADEVSVYVVGNQIIGSMRLLPGPNSLKIEARSGRSAVATSSTIRVEKEKSNLYVLSIGTSPPDLDYPEIDACDFANVLRGQASGHRRLFSNTKVETLLGDEATAENMEVELNKLADNDTIRKNDLVMVFFSAHGALNDEGQFYIQGDDYRRVARKHTTILGQDIFDILHRIKCRKMVFFDACHSGTKSGGDDEDLNAAVQQLLTPMTGYTVISSSGKNEKSHEDKKWGHGAFTEFLLKGLAGEADHREKPDGIITIHELYKYLEVAVPLAVDSLKQRPQTPQLIADSLGNLPFFLTENYDLSFSPCGNGIKNTIAEAELMYKTVFVQGGIINMVKASGGKNLYVNKKPVKVTAFNMGIYEVTNAQYSRFLNEAGNNKNTDQWIKLKNNKCKITKRGGIFMPKEGSNRLPVVTVSWEGAIKYAQWLSSKTGLTYRLPTEEEWEYAAHSGHYLEDVLYAGSNELELVGWHKENSENKVHEVGFKQANSLGIYDLSGNVEEWCMDTYDKPIQADIKSKSQNKDKLSWATIERIARGGHFNSEAKDCLNKTRSHYPGNSTQAYLGFRLVRVAH